MKGNLSDLMLPAPVGGGFEMEGYWVWCGTVIKGEDGGYHMFASRWPKTLPMHPGWLLASEVVRAQSPTPEGPYTFAEVVLPARGAQYWDGRATHNPHITKIGDTYVLYYMGTTHPFPEPAEGTLTCDDCRTIVARSNKRIGIATSKSVFGPWERRDQPILTTRPDKFDNFLISNPAPCVSADQSVTMIYKSRTYARPPYPAELHSGRMFFGVARADQYEGPYRRLLDEPLFAQEDFNMEDPFLWQDEDGFNMMAKDMDGRICGQKQGGFYAGSPDGVHWTVKKGELFYSRKILWDDGVVREMGNLERPFLLFENGVPTHAFFATGEGRNEDGFSKLKRTWNMVVPLKQK